MKFKLLAGKHSQKEVVIGPDGQPTLDDNGNPVRAAKLYIPGQIVETEVDLAKLFNGPGALKFERLEDKSDRQQALVQDANRAADMRTVAAPGGQVSQGHQFTNQPRQVQTPVPAETATRPSPPANPRGEEKGGDAPQSTTSTGGGKSRSVADRVQESSGKRLEEMNVQELRAAAEAEEVNISGAGNQKDKLVKAIREAK